MDESHEATKRKAEFNRKVGERRTSSGLRPPSPQSGEGSAVALRAMARQVGATSPSGLIINFAASCEPGPRMDESHEVSR